MAPAGVSRASTFFRLVLMLPLFLFLTLLGGTGFFTLPAFMLSAGLASFLLLIHIITVLVRGRPVDWVWGTLVAAQRFILRAQTYFLLITDRYPPFEGEWPVTFVVQRPQRISRWQLLIWKTLASLPHVIVLTVLWFAVVACVVISWFAILVTGRYPLGLRGFVVGWLRWYARVNAYWMSLRDEFPPFSLSPESAPASRRTHVASGAGGFVLASGAIAGIVALILMSANTEKVEVSYGSLREGVQSPTLVVDHLGVALLEADDDYTFADQLFVPQQDERFVVLSVWLFNTTNVDKQVHDGLFRLTDTAGERHRPFVSSYEGLPLPQVLEGGDSGGGDRAEIRLIFELPDGETPQVFEFEPDFLQKAKFEFTR